MIVMMTNAPPSHIRDPREKLQIQQQHTKKQDRTVWECNGESRFKSRVSTRNGLQGNQVVHPIPSIDALVPKPSPSSGPLMATRAFMPFAMSPPPAQVRARGHHHPASSRPDFCSPWVARAVAFHTIPESPHHKASRLPGACGFDRCQDDALADT
jgi:hypothetical protein